MKKYILILLIILSNYLPAADIPKRGKIIIEIENFKNDKGVVRSQLFNKDQANYFPTKSELAFTRLVGTIHGFRARLIYNDLPFGVYAIAFHHDEDNDGKMNRNFLGIPTEGYGFSNNPKIYTGPPTFDESKIILQNDVLTIKVKMND